MSTNINAYGNPIKSAAQRNGGALPFLVGGQGIINVGVDRSITVKSFAADWDVLVLSDGETGLPGELPKLKGFEVLWLVHGLNVAEAQRKDLKKLFGEITHEESFHHDDSGYGKYLDFVAKLCDGGETYSDNLIRLDKNLRKEGMEATVVEFLWLLAALNARPGDTVLQEKLNEAAVTKYDELVELGVSVAEGLPPGADLDELQSEEYGTVKATLLRACRAS